jgi:hypothetical protein
VSGILTLARAVRVVKPLLLGQFESSNSRCVAVERLAEAVAALVVEILSRCASASLAATRAITSVPVFSSGARLGFALALAELVVPVLVGATAFVLHTLTFVGLSVKEKP